MRFLSELFRTTMMFASICFCLFSPSLLAIDLDLNNQILAHSAQEKATISENGYNDKDGNQFEPSLETMDNSHIIHAHPDDNGIYNANLAMSNEKQYFWYSYYEQVKTTSTYLTQSINSNLNNIFWKLSPIKSVEAGGIGYVAKKIFREVKRILKQLFRLLNKAGIDRVGVKFGFDGNGKPHVRDVHFGTPNKERVIVYESHNPDESTTWKSEVQQPKSSEKDSTDNPYDTIDARDTLLKSFKVVEEPKYALQEGDLIWNFARQARIYPGQKVYQIFGWNYDIPDTYYDYGHHTKLTDARNYGVKLSEQFSEYDSKIKSYRMLGVTSDKDELKEYERKEWDRLISEAAKYLFKNGMWNREEVKKEFKDGFISRSKLFGDANNEFMAYRVDAIMTNIQNELEFQMNRGYGQLFSDVEQHLKTHLDDAAMNNALGIVAKKRFVKDLSEGAGQLLEMDKNDFEPIQTGKRELYKFEMGGKMYTFENAPGIDLETVKKLAAELRGEEAKKLKDLYGVGPEEFSERLSTATKIGETVISAIDFKTVKRKIVTNAILGGSLSKDACEGVCTAVTTATGGLIGMEAGAAVGIAGGPPGVAVGSGAGSIVGSTIGYINGKVACRPLCIALSQNAQAITDDMNVAQSETALFSEKAPGMPTENDGYIRPKKWGGKKVKNPNGQGYGYPDDKGRVWVPTGDKDHGGPHWDVEKPGGGYQNIYPGGKIRSGKN